MKPLNEKRKEILDKIRENYPYLEITVYQQEDILRWISEQDKEAVKKLKEDMKRVIKYHHSWTNIEGKIDKIFGKELSK